MTQEEKARAYDEAIERARRIKNGGDNWRYSDLTEIIPALEEVLPELAESDDERIRKEIIEFIRSQIEDGNSVGWDRWIAYLEKQKEQKPIIQDVELNDAVYDYVRDHFIAGADFTPEYIKKLMENAFFAGVDYYLLKQESESCEPDTNVEKVIEDVIRVYGKTQGEWVGGYDVDTLIVNLRRAFNKKEQKPAGKQDYTTLTDIERAIHRGFLSAGVTNIPVEIIEETAKECIALMKPAEWSEEDRKHLNSVLLSLNRPFYNMNEQEKSDFDWLHELPERFNLQPKQEWSDEDEKMLKWIEDILLIADDDLSDKLNGKVRPITDSAYSSMKICIAKCRSWLKSLPLNLKKKNEDVAKLCSNEWSEEDEEMKERLITRLNWITYNTRTDGTSPNITFFDEINWLKSLKPQSSWKPSEEQMSYLWSIYRGGEEQELLRELIQDLKKL